MADVLGPNENILVRLLERLASASGFSDACTAFLEEAAAVADFGRAAILLWHDGELAVHADGFEPEAVAALRAAAADADRFLNPRAGADAGERVRPVPELGLEQATLIRFDAGPWAGPGVAIIEGPADRALALFAELLPRCGPSLGAQLRLRRADPHRQDAQLELLTGILHALPDPVVVTDPSNSILLANQRAEQLFSSQAADSGGRRRAIEINNLLFGSFLSQTAAAATELGPRELNLVDPSDGSDLLIEVLSVPMPYAGEGAVLSILRNITDLKRAVAELEDQIHRSRAAEHRSRRERDQLNVVLENVTDPILVTDDKSNIILVNREGERLFVAGAGSDEHSRHRRAVRANDTTFTTLISDFLLQMQQRRVEKLELLDPDSGSPFPAEVVSSKILNARGEPTAIVSVVHDLTQVAENERLARELQDLNEDLEERIARATQQLADRNRQLEWQSQELEKASRLKSEFLANMSHELRTPINVVLGYTSLMRERIYGELSGQQEEALEKIYGTSQHLLELINDILDLSKIEAGKMPVHLEEVDLASLVDELSEQVEPLLSRRALAYRREVAPGLPAIRTDRTKLKQILLNLVSNAIKFTHEGSVTLRAELVDRQRRVRISVIDTGIGIKPEHLKTIFEDFRQVDQSPTREYGGTGLGLSITKKLLSLLGGVISVESTYGSGSTFTVELPLNAQTGTVDEQVHRALVGADRTVIDAERDRADEAEDAEEDSRIARNVDRTRDAVAKVVRRLGGK